MSLDSQVDRDTQIVIMVIGKAMTVQAGTNFLK